MEYGIKGFHQLDKESVRGRAVYYESKNKKGNAEVKRELDKSKWKPVVGMLCFALDIFLTLPMRSGISTKNRFCCRISLPVI